MIFHGFDLICPFCKGELWKLSGEEWRCHGCLRSYPVIFGIPDLRIAPDPDMDIENDRAKAVHLAGHFDELSFEELVRFYYLTTPSVPEDDARKELRAILTAEASSESHFQQWERAAGASAGSDSFLEIGCGTAPLLVAAVPRFKATIGMDNALRWLILAKKRLSQHGLTAIFICACVEALPFVEASIGTVAFDSALENFGNQRMALQESFRVLKPDGKVLITTANRLYARRQNETVPRAKYLSSAGSLHRLLQESGFKSISVLSAALQMKQTSRLIRGIARLYNISQHTRLGQLLFRSMGPLLFAVARKPEKNISRSPNQKG